jgi:hypothetical protein
MTTADILMERALSLASEEIETEQAVQELLAASGDRRVAVVLARRHLLERQEENHDAQTGRAADLLEEVLTRLPQD